MTYEIVKNMPMPDRSFDPKGGQYVSKYPFYKMEVGDCVLFDDANSARVAWSSAYAYSLKIQVEAKFEKRQLDDGRYGIWRVK
jgi:hypothetical protein